MLVACGGNDPIQPEEEQEFAEYQEFAEQLSDAIEGIGKITGVETKEDGSVVLTDDQGNIITQDAEGNISIVMSDGETVLMDNSIKEDPTAPKDKWYNTKWGSVANYNSPDIDPNGGKYAFLRILENYMPRLESSEVSKDSTVVFVDEEIFCTLSFFTTTASRKLEEKEVRYTYERTYHFTKYDVVPQTVGDGDIRYRLAIEDYLDFYGNPKKEAILYEDHYDYNPENGSFDLGYSELIWSCDVEPDNAIYITKEFQTNSEKEEVLSNKVTTKFYNYRRLGETKIAANNKEESFILEENTESEAPMPEMSAYDTKGNHLMDFVLVSF